MDYAILKEELKNDPLTLGYAGKSCEEIVVLLNTPISNHTKRRPNGKTPLYKVLGYLGATGVLAVLDRLSKDTSSSTPQAIGAQSAALAAINIFYLSGIENLDLDDAQSQALYSALVALGLVSQDTITGLLALADYQISRAEYLFNAPVTLIDVQSQWPIKVALHYPYFSVQPVNQQKYVGQSLTLTVDAFCLAACMPITYQWQKDNVDIQGATSSTLTIATLTLADAGSYSCTATNTEASKSSLAATVNVIAEVAPILEVQPTTQSVLKGETAQFTVSATGAYGFSYQWAKDSVDIAGATSNTLVIPNAQPTDSGSYTCTVTDTAGSTTSNPATLTVSLLAPRITRSLSNLTVTENSLVELMPQVDGSEPMTYEWKLNGNILPNDSATLIFAANITSAGVYNFTASNDAGSASTSATLAIF